MIDTTSRLRFALGRSSLGDVLVAATDTGLCAIEFGGDPQTLVRTLQARHPRAQLVEDDAGLRQALAGIVEVIATPTRAVDVPLDPHGTDFQRRVWRALREIAPGSTASYGEIARRVGRPAAARAVARACAANTLAVAIPCHRVIRENGTPSGYRWGVARKRALLAREGARCA